MRFRLFAATWLLAGAVTCNSALSVTPAQQAQRFVAALNADSVDVLLRTKTGSVPVKQGPGWVQGSEPDRAKTIEHVKLMVKAGGIGLGGTAQVSCGISPCGEPCRCKVGKTRHLSGQAAGLNSRDLLTLSTTLARAKAGTVDQYLAKFGLHRPLVKHPTSPEEWHVEARL
ncbi:MAG: hypothetical protein ABR499_10695 [Gemmatimonadaceae bacterium]